MVRPAILAVDDDPEVLGAVERDLRQHYRDDYRILKAGRAARRSRPSAQLKQRGTRRRPLPGRPAHARDDGHGVPARGDQALSRIATGPADGVRRHPGRDRRRSTTSGLDHYLLKPWDPPERASLSGPRRPAVGLDGARAACPSKASASPARAGRRRATRSRISSRATRFPTSGSTSTRTRPTRELIRLAGRPRAACRCVLFPDGSRLVAPANARAGGEGRPADAGHAALLRRGRHRRRARGAGGRRLRRLRRAAHGARRAERAGRTGGHELPDRELSRLPFRRLRRRPGAPRRDAGAALRRRDPRRQEVVSLRREDPYRIVRLADGTEISCYAVVLATGMSVPDASTCRAWNRCWASACTTARR